MNVMRQDGTAAGDVGKGPGQRGSKKGAFLDAVRGAIAKQKVILECNVKVRKAIEQETASLNRKVSRFNDRIEMSQKAIETAASEKYSNDPFTNKAILGGRFAQ